MTDFEMLKNMMAKCGKDINTYEVEDGAENERCIFMGEDYGTSFYFDKTTGELLRIVG